MSEAQLTPKEIYELCNGTSKSCVFDFSTIPMSISKRFFDSFPNFIYKKCEELTLCIDLKHKAESNECSPEDAKKVSLSISTQKTNYVSYLIKILASVLPKTKTITTLNIRGIHINHASFSALFDCITSSQSLRNFSLTDIPIHHEIFIKFLEQISPYRFESLIFQNCNLSVSEFPAIIKFLQQKGRPGSTYILQKFDVTKNHFTVEQLHNITEEISQMRFVPSLTRNIQLDLEEDNPEDPSDIHDIFPAQNKAPKHVIITAPPMPIPLKPTFANVASRRLSCPVAHRGDIIQGQNKSELKPQNIEIPKEVENKENPIPSALNNNQSDEPKKVKRVTISPESLRQAKERLSQPAVKKEFLVSPASLVRQKERLSKPAPKKEKLILDDDLKSMKTKLRAIPHDTNAEFKKLFKKF